MQLINTEAVQTMTSREIADLTGKEHRNVMRDIRVMLVELYGEGGVHRFEHTLRNQQNGVPYPIYTLPKRESLILVSGYNLAMRTKIIDRWQELEAQQPAPLDLNDPHALRTALLSYSERVIVLEAKVTADAPKVAFAEAIRAVEGVCSIEKIAKTIGIGRNKLFKRMRDDGILMPNNLPYQKYIDREYFTVIEQEPFTDSKGVQHPTFTTRVTGAGQVFLAKKYANIMKSTD